MIKIKRKVTGKVLQTVDAGSLKYADLEGVDLEGADLRRAVLWYANLRYADLRSADLRGADLREADLRGADLWYADLEGVDLEGADLRGADLWGADLRYAVLRGADLRGATINWDSHDLVSAILMSHAGTNAAKRKVAGLILASRDWCWAKFLRLRDPNRVWALRTLAKYVKEGDGAPDILRNRKV